MNCFLRIGVLAVLIALGCLSSQGHAKVYLANDPIWSGYWIWGSADNVPPAKIDLGAWLTANPGGWGEALVNRILGDALSVGIRDVYLQMQDNQGRLLYPSAQREKVLRWTNWGVDFGQTDMPALAIKAAKKMHLNLKLVGDEAFLPEIRRLYPDVETVGLEALPAGVIDGVEITRDNLGKFKKYQNSHAQYFRKTFAVSGPVKSAELCITAMPMYRVYLDGKLIGTDSTWQDGETYMITDRLTTGRHVLAVEVIDVKPSWLVGLMVNLRWAGNDGKTHLLATDPGWRRTENVEAGWTLLKFDDRKWGASAIVGVGGLGDRFLRLRDPWQNPRPLLSSVNCDDMLITGIKVVTKQNPKKAFAVTDLGIDEAYSPPWTCKSLPEIVVMKLPHREWVCGIRIYSGWLRYDYSPSGPGEIKRFKLQALENKEWVDLCPEQDAKPYLREFPSTTFYHEAFFKPVECDQVRLVIEESYDAGWRLGNLGGKPLPASKRWCNIREIELLRSAAAVCSRN